MPFEKAWIQISLQYSITGYFDYHNQIMSLEFPDDREKKE